MILFTPQVQDALWSTDLRTWVRYVFQPSPVIYTSDILLCPRRLRRRWLATHTVKDTELCSRIFRLYW
jgi:hypothetical protein